MSFDKGFRIDLTPDQVVALAKQLPGGKKIELAEAFEREGLVKRLKHLMESFKTDELDEKTIHREVEIVRARRYAARRKKAAKSLTGKKFRSCSASLRTRCA